MEYLERGDLQRYLTCALPEAEAREISCQVLEGLNHMHDNRFIHRDLKPRVSCRNSGAQSYANKLEHHGRREGSGLVGQNR